MFCSLFCANKKAGCAKILKHWRHNLHSVAMAANRFFKCLHTTKMNSFATEPDGFSLETDLLKYAWIIRFSMHQHCLFPLCVTRSRHIGFKRSLISTAGVSDVVSDVPRNIAQRE